MKKNRNKKIIKTSIISILSNIFLSLFKLIVGLLSNSIAIILDSVNNLTDALSSIITIVGTLLASKKPDKKHPYGYGRIEYLSAMSISLIILYAGFASLVESIKKIIKPDELNYTNITILVVVVAMIVKILLGLYVKKMGKKYNSNSLINSGEDALLDSIISLSTFVSIIVFLNFKISLEAYLAFIISILIIKSGLEMLKKTFSQILGERIDIDISKKVKKIVLSFKEVKGIYDLILNNYGPDIFLGSFHIEVSDDIKATDIDHLTRKITKSVYEKCNIVVTAIGIYTSNDNNEFSKKIKKEVIKILDKYESVLEMHGFYVNEQKKDINFDLVFDFSEKNIQKNYYQILEEISNKYKDYNVYIFFFFFISS